MAQFGPYDRSLRAADSDRESVAEILREQHVAGRLDDDEFQERIERCFAAKTYAQLDAVVADLPQEEPAMPRMRHGWGRPRFALVALLFPLIAIIALSHGHLIWLAIPLFFFVVRPVLWGGRMCGPRYAASGSRSASTIV